MRSRPTKAGGRATLTRAAASLLLAVAALLLADLLLLNIHAASYTLDVGTYRAGYFFSGIFEPESGGDGRAYRWTSQQTTMHLEQVRVSPQTLLALDLGGRPAPAAVQMTLDGQPWLTFQAEAQGRSYLFVLPPTPTRTLTLGIQSSVFTAGGDDTRQLGVKLQRVRIVAPGSALRTPGLAVALAQAGLLVVALLLLVRLGWRWRAIAAALGVLAFGLAGLLAGDLLSAYPYTLRLLGASLALLLLTWVGLPLTLRLRGWAGGARELTLLWSLMLLACAVRLMGMLYPTFGGQDQFLHLKLLREVTEGQLVHTVVASEFGGGLALYPPATYLAIALGRVLIGDPVALLQGSLALYDGLNALLVALLARRLGGNRYAARMALLLYAGSLTAFTAMSYGFSAQLFGQCLIAPLALALMADDPPLSRRAWFAAALLLLLAVSSHIGVALLGSVWVGITLLLMLARPHRNLLWAFGVLVGCAAFAFLTLYIDGVGTMLGHFGQGRGDAPGGWLPGATPLLWVGLRLAYSGVGLALLPLGLLWIGRSRRAAQPKIVALTWVLTVLLFLLIDLLLALQVRYFYFFLPLALAAIGLVLGALAERGRWGYRVAWLLVLFVSVQGVVLWFGSAFGSGKLSLTPLTH